MNGDTLSVNFKAPKECSKKFLLPLLKGNSLLRGNVLRIFFLLEDFGRLYRKGVARVALIKRLRLRSVCVGILKRSVLKMFVLRTRLENAPAC